MIRSLLWALALCLCSATASRAQSVIYSADQLSEVPKLASPVRAAEVMRAAYPEDLRRAHVSGTVQVEFVVNADGKVEPGSVKVIMALPASMSAVAEKVVPKLEFVPGKKDGTAVRTQVRMPLNMKP